MSPPPSCTGTASPGSGSSPNSVSARCRRSSARPRDGTSTPCPGPAIPAAWRPGGAAWSIGAQRALGRRPRTPAEVEAYLHGLADRLGHRLRAAERLCRTVVLRLRFDDFSRATRSHTLPEATDHGAVILRTARALLTAALPMIRERGLTLVGLSLTNLENADPRQLALPLDTRPGADLDATLDRLRDRFGAGTVTRAALLGRGEGLSVPLLPD